MNVSIDSVDGHNERATAKKLHDAELDDLINVMHLYDEDESLHEKTKRERKQKR